MLFDEFSQLLAAKDFQHAVSRMGDVNWDEVTLEMLVEDDNFPDFYWAVSDEEKAFILSVFDKANAIKHILTEDRMLLSAIEHRHDLLLDKMIPHGLFLQNAIEVGDLLELSSRVAVYADEDIEISKSDELSIFEVLLLLYPEFLSRHSNDVVAEENLKVCAMAQPILREKIASLFLYLTERCCFDEHSAKVSFDLLLELTKCSTHDMVRSHMILSDDERVPMALIAVGLGSLRLLRFLKMAGQVSFELYVTTRDGVASLTTFCLAMGRSDLVEFVLEHGGALEFHPENPLMRSESYESPFDVIGSSDSKIDCFDGNAIRMIREAKARIEAEYRKAQGEPDAMLSAFEKKLAVFNEGVLEIRAAMAESRKWQIENQASLASMKDTVSAMTESLSNVQRAVKALEDRVAIEASATEVASLKRGFSALQAENDALKNAFSGQHANKKIQKLEETVAALQSKLDDSARTQTSSWGVGRMFGVS